MYSGYVIIFNYKGRTERGRDREKVGERERFFSLPDGNTIKTPETEAGVLWSRVSAACHALIPYLSTCAGAIVSFMQVNWQDRGALVNLVEVVKIHSNDIHDEICLYWDIYFLGPMSVACTWQTEKGPS